MVAACLACKLHMPARHTLTEYMLYIPCIVYLLNLHTLCVVPSATAASSTKPTGATRASRRTSSSSAVHLTPQSQQLTPQSTPITPLLSNTEGLQPSQALAKRHKTAASVGKPSGSSHSNEGQERQALKGSVQEGNRQLPGVGHTEDTAARTADGKQAQSEASVMEGNGQDLVAKAQEDDLASAGKEDGFAITCTCVVLALVAGRQGRQPSPESQQQVLWCMSWTNQQLCRSMM